MWENPTVHRNVAISRKSTTLINSGTAEIVEKFHARVYSAKDGRKTTPIEANSLEQMKQKIDAILDE